MSQLTLTGRNGVLARDSHGVVLLGLALLSAVVFGLAAGASPVLALAAAVGAVVAIVTVLNLAAGLCIFLCVAFLEALPHVAGAASVAKLTGLLLLGAWLASMAISHQEERRSRDLLARHVVLVWALVLFAGWALASVIWAEEPLIARTTAMRFVLNFALFPIVYAALRGVREAQWLFCVYIGGALFSAGYGFLTSGLSDDGRLSGSGVNPNQLGGLLIVSVVMSLALACNRQWALPVRALLVVASAASGMALIATASRGALLGLVVSTLVAPLLIGKGRRLRAAGVVGLAAVIGIVCVLALAPAGTLSRYKSAEHSGTGRVDLWTVGLRMVEDKPVRGVGAGNFQTSSIHYLLRPGTILRDDFIVDEPKVAHNIYLAVLAELGVVGLAIFLFILGYCLRCALVGARLLQRAGDLAGEVIARGLLIALVGLLAADFFSSQLYSKQLWLLLAVTPVMLAFGERAESRARRATARSESREVT
jgi:O-antigen ligase